MVLPIWIATDALAATDLGRGHARPRIATIQPFMAGSFSIAAIAAAVSDAHPSCFLKRSDRDV
jgi:hypothetical protein